MVETQPATDYELLQRIASGDENALEIFYQQHGGRILNYLDGMLQDEQRAEEILQDVMEAVWENASSFRGESKVRTWLFTIARNHAINAIRGRKLILVPLNDDIFSENANAFIEFELVQALEQAFEQLSSRHREVLELKFYHGLKMAEISEVLAVPLGTVQSRLYHAKQEMRRLLKKEGIDHA